MRDLLDGAGGEWMDLTTYYADYEQHFWSIGVPGFWKVERQQSFQEPKDSSWEAFARGDWQEALRLLEARRADTQAYFRQIAERGFTVYRVRVVEEPLAAYLQWELHALRLREECGAKIRVIGAEHVEALETSGALPEVYTLGTEVMYEAIYDERGVLEAARRYTDRELIARCQSLIADLYAVGEPLEGYFARQVAPLPAPSVPQSA